MKDKLEPNMYVRTKWGYICELININDFREPSMKYGVEANYLKDVMFIGDDDVVKASYNIIDILEKGDYVNGKKIYSLGLTIGILNTINFEDGTFTISEDIKSVITHEQMEQMAYKVGD